MTSNPSLYDPKSIADIVFPCQHSSDVIHDIVNGDLPFPLSGKNGLLLYGVPGTGKSALAKLLPDAVEAVKTGEPADKLYVQIKQGANGAAVINSISNRALTWPLTGSHHYFVLDEVDNLTKDAMLSLKSAMNSPNSIFILTTNYIQKLEMGVINRCHRIEFNAAPAQAWLPLFKRVLVDQNVAIPPDRAILPVIAACNGSARDIFTSAFTLANRQRRLAVQAGTAAQSSAPVPVLPTTNSSGSGANTP